MMNTIKSAQGVSNEVASSTASTDFTFLPWPPQQPYLNVPYFTEEQYRAVNLNARHSCLSNGLDLPFNDICTLRFFFNIGVSQVRTILLNQISFDLSLAPGNMALGDSSANVPSSRTTNAVNQNEQYLQLLRQCSRQQLQLSASALGATQRLLSPLQPTSSQPGLFVNKDRLPTISNASSDSTSEGLSLQSLEALTLQQVLLASANDDRSGISGIAHLHYQLALNAAAQGLLASQTSTLAQTIQQQQMLRCAAISDEQLADTSNNAPISLLQIPVDPTPSNSEISPSCSTHFRTTEEENNMARETTTGSDSLEVSTLLDVAAVQKTRLQSLSLSVPVTTTSTSQISNEVETVLPQVSKSVRDELPPLSVSLFGASEMHYSEAFNTSGSEEYQEKTVATSAHDDRSFATSSSLERNGTDGRQALPPQLMINLLNGILSKVKNELHQQGMGVNLDAIGRPIDFSARPVDPIFRRAREQLENSRGYPPSTQPNLTGHRPSCSIGEGEIVRLASRRLQNSVCTVESDDEIPKSQLVMTTTTAALPACNSESQQLASNEEFETFTEDEYSAKRKSDSEEKSERHSPPSKLQKLSVINHDGEVSMN